MDRPIAYLLGPAAESQLVDSLRAGEAASYRHLYNRFAPKLERTLTGIFRDRQLARDAVQSTFLIVFRKIGQFDGRSALGTWITRIGIREAGRLARAAGAERRTAEEAAREAPPEPVPSPEKRCADLELSRRLDQLIAALPIEKRTALLLFEVEGFSVAEIAETVGEPRGTILARLSRTRVLLREALVAAETPMQGKSKSNE